MKLIFLMKLIYTSAMQLTMTPEKTNFITQGYDGLRRLKAGPMLDSYRGLSIIHSRQYSLETGAPPRDLLRRRVRVGEYYRIPWSETIGNNGENVMIDLYDEAKDTFFTTSWKELLNHAALDESDKHRFNNMGNQIDSQDKVPIEPILNPDQNQDTIDIIRVPLNWGNALIARDQLRVLGGDIQTICQNMHDLRPLNDQTDGLIIKTHKITEKINRVQDNRGKKELQSFYKGSGLYNATVSGNNIPQEDMFLDMNMYYSTFFNNIRTNGRDFFYVPTVVNNDIPVINDRRIIFRKLMFGDLNRPNIMIGMRPNLHIGSMVFADQTPDNMRFVHIAGHVIAQTVVTRPVAIRLMQQVEFGVNAQQQTPINALHNKISYLFGADPDSRNYIQNNPNAVRTAGRSYYNWPGSVLAYICASILHPDASVRDQCKAALLNKMQLDLDEFGQNLATWIKLMVNGTPATNKQGNTNSPLFDAYVQGRVLETTLLQHMTQDPEMDDAGRVSDNKRGKIPVMYLGEHISVADKDAAYVGAAGGLLNAIDTSHPKWLDYVANDDFAVNRDVDERTFKSRLSGIFPIKKNQSIKPADLIAVTRTANCQDTLVAFATIMAKRFFAINPELYVEVPRDGQQYDGSSDVNFQNQNISAADYAFMGNVSRRSLTSNDYPVLCTGPRDLFNKQEHWEIVIVRPNIEHNMLAAVLGRGGSEDLGSTFWGQTELSCYDDAMHGVWGMSYKYHERAMVTNEKNLIRLFDIAYDGYNGGKDDVFVSWVDESGYRSYNSLKAATANVNTPYTGPSLMVMAFPVDVTVSYVYQLFSHFSPSFLVVTMADSVLMNRTRCGIGTGLHLLCSMIKTLESPSSKNPTMSLILITSRECLMRR